jgi:hypothetical protein
VAVILDQQDIDVFIGLDVGKSGHHAVGLNRAGKKLFDKALPNDEARLRRDPGFLSGHGKILLIVDQPATTVSPGGLQGLTAELKFDAGRADSIRRRRRTQYAARPRTNGSQGLVRALQRLLHSGLVH